MNEEKQLESVKRWILIALTIPIIISSVYTAKEVTEIKGILTNLNAEQRVDTESKNYKQYPLKENQRDNPVENSTNRESTQPEENHQDNINNNQTNPQPEEESIKQSEVVYVTETGECYHRNGCKHLRYSKIEIDREQAEKNYRPCKDCFPELYSTN